jgi:hypothetical protein
MTDYIPHYTKKKQVLARKEDALSRLIRRNAPMSKVVAAAEGVRDARIRVVRAQRATIAPRDDAQEQYDALDARIEAIANTPIAVLLAEFGYTVDEGVD